MRVKSNAGFVPEKGLSHERDDLESPHGGRFGGGKKAVSGFNRVLSSSARIGAFGRHPGDGRSRIAINVVSMDPDGG